MIKHRFSCFCSWLRSQISDIGILGFISCCLIFALFFPFLLPCWLISAFNDWSRTWFKEV